jgi:hypothetical protein
MELPSHPESDDQESPTAVNWIAVLAVSVAVALVAVLLILHLAGVVGPAGD